jgi:hypothetical protein
MRSPLLACCLAVVAAALPRPVSAQSLAAVVGTWRGQAFVRDTAVTALTLVATADGKRWTLAYGAGTPIPTRVLATGGDSIVTESGPYASVSRKGQTVVTRVVWRLRGDTLSGDFAANYSVSGITRGRMVAVRKTP